MSVLVLDVKFLYLKFQFFNVMTQFDHFLDRF